MGHKANPIGMRLQVNKDWRSKWYASKKEYTQFLLEDLAVRKAIEDRYSGRSTVSKVDIERSATLASITIHTSKAGVIIGRGGSGIEELKKIVQKIMNIPVRLNVEEVKKPELHAKLVAENIARQLENRIAFRRAVKFGLRNTMQAGAKGIRIEVAGRLNNAEMARREKFSEGAVPLHTLRSDIDYALSEAKTPAGKIGVKVWINRGEVV